MAPSLDQIPNPFPAYAEMRRNSPVFFNAAHGNWTVYRYDDVRAVCMDHVNFSNKYDALLPPERTIIGTIATADQPQHTKLRNLVSRAFTPKAISDMEGAITRISHEYLDAVVESGRMDLLRDLAIPVPVWVISEMLGIPFEDREQFKRWSDHVVESFESIMTGDMSPKPEYDATFRDMKAYLARVSRQRREKPTGDLISNLVMAEVDGERLTEEEVVFFCILLLVAGNETTTNLVSNAIYCLLQAPDQLELLRANPSLAASAIEETLRFRTPAQFQTRVALRDVEMHGQVIRAGQPVLYMIGSANRDEARFTEPDKFDITRKPNQHLAFGHGIHFCLGAPLARLEGRIILSAIIERLQELRLDEELPVVPTPTMAILGFRSLPLRFRPGRRRSNS